MTLELVHLVGRWGAVLGLSVGIELPFDQSLGFTVGDRLVCLLLSATGLGKFIRLLVSRETAVCRDRLNGDLHPSAFKCWYGHVQFGGGCS